MRWINRQEQEPDPKKYEYILVIGACGKPHVAYYSYEDWNHTECCYSSGNHFSGEVIQFERWKPFSKNEEE